MAFPTGLPSYLGFTSTHTLAADLHASQHNSEQADITAIATKIGTGSSTPVNQRLLRGNGTGTSAWAQADLTTDVTGVLPIANGGNGTTSTTGTGSVVFASTPTLTGGSWGGSPTITTPTIASFTNAQHNHQNAAGGSQLNGANAIQAVTIPSSAMNLTKTSADANGWIKRDYGNWQQYEQSIGTAGVVIAGNGNTSFGSINLPVGVTDSSSLRFWTGILGGFGGRIMVTLDNGDTLSAVTSVTIQLGNLTTGSITFIGYIYIYAITI